MIRPLPPAPSRADPANFSARGDALLAALPDFVADANLLEQSLQWVGTTGTSATSVTVGTGSKAFTTQPNKAWAVGVWVYAVSSSGMGNIMQGQVTAYDVDAGVLTVNVIGAAGSGAHVDWIIGLAPAIASAGTIGVTDAGGRFSGLNVEAVLTEVARLEGDMIKLDDDATDPLHAVPLQQVQALIAAAVDAAVSVAVPPGTISAKARLVAPDRWLLIDGKTIGDAASGGTARANADTWLLYEQLWAFDAAAVPIYTNTGAASTRGASAAADFAAGKRLPLFTPDGGAFIRMWTPDQTRDAGRVAGSVQEDAIRNITGSFHAVRTSFHQDGAFYDTGWRINGSDSGGVPTPVVGFSAANVVPTAAENRPYSLAIPHYFFLGLA